MENKIIEQDSLTLGRGNKYLHRVMLVLVVVAMVGFALASLARGAGFGEFPLITHTHAVLMSMWLILSGVQSHLGSSGSIVLHKRLGKLGIALALLVVPTGIMTTFDVISTGRLAPFFTPGYFLTLGFSNLTAFAIFVGAAVVLRKNTNWHRRLMLGALIVIYEPVLGRILPFFVIPLLGGNPETAFAILMDNRALLEFLRIGVHLSIVLVVMLGDRAVTGRFHPVYGYLFIAVIGIYAAINSIGSVPAVAEFASGLANE